MTNWLEPEEVRAAYNKAESTRGKWSIAATEDYHARNAQAVLSALAELPEPNTRCDICTYGAAHKRHQSPTDNHEYKDNLLHRLWTIARIVVGKEGA